MEVVHPRVAIDTAPHPTRLALRLELDDPSIVLQAATRNPHLDNIREAPHHSPLGQHGVQADPITRPEINGRQRIDRRPDPLHHRIELLSAHGLYPSTGV
ncbi:hypothetical protein BH24ACT6_BH24ACT6_14580 [soil metagenome]